MKRYLLTSLSLILSISIMAQENSCPTLERAAISESSVWCSDLGQGQACYGNSGASADLLSDMSFNTAGDRVALTDLTQITGTTGDNRYGITLVHTTGYANDNWLAQDVSLAILGNVTIANTGNEGINVTTLSAIITDEQGANIRSGPTTDYRVLTSLFEGEAVKLTGRFRDDSFYRVQLPSGELGWISAGAVNVDVSDLPLVDLEDTAPDQIYVPFTSFSLETGIDDAGCADAWDSGVLLQSPEESTIRFRVNGWVLTLSGTVFLQAEEARDLVHVIEGVATYDDETIEEGYTLALFEESYNIAPYDIAELAPLPTEILPRYTYIGIELSTIITPAPTVDRSPIADVLVGDPCVITTGQGGANLRSGPGGEFPIRGVMAFRETVHPISRTNGSDNTVWYELAQNIWVSNQVIVTGGDCLAVPQSTRIPVPLPTTNFED